MLSVLDETAFSPAQAGIDPFPGSRRVPGLFATSGRLPRGTLAALAPRWPRRAASNGLRIWEAPLARTLREQPTPILLQFSRSCGAAPRKNSSPSSAGRRRISGPQTQPAKGRYIVDETDPGHAFGVGGHPWERQATWPDDVGQQQGIRWSPVPHPAPPAANTVSPEIQRASSEARKTATGPMSPGRPIRPSGIDFAICSS